MDFSDIFRVVNLAAGVLMILAGVTRFIPGGFSIPAIILAIYLFIFGLATALLEFQIPPQVARYASFMFSFIGRGAFYIFLGMLSADSHWYKWLPGSLLAAIGVAYVALEFAPSIEPPANMRDASDAGWGAEQV